MNGSFTGVQRIQEEWARLSATVWSTGKTSGLSHLQNPGGNGIVEQFNDDYQQKFLSRVTMASILQLRQESLTFEHRHNSVYRYSKLKGKTPLQALVSANAKLIYSGRTHVTKHPLYKPEEGYCHLVRFIRSDCRLYIFGETFSAPREIQYAYVVATSDVKDQKLKVFLDTIQVEEYQYRLR